MFRSSGDGGEAPWGGESLTVEGDDGGESDQTSDLHQSTLCQGLTRVRSDTTRGGRTCRMLSKQATRPGKAGEG